MNHVWNCDSLLKSEFHTVCYLRRIFFRCGLRNHFELIQSVQINIVFSQIATTSG